MNNRCPKQGCDGTLKPHKDRDGWGYPITVYVCNNPHCRYKKTVTKSDEKGGKNG
jgi:hypothetical protein